MGGLGGQACQWERTVAGAVACCLVTRPQPPASSGPQREMRRETGIER
jgi:hypothetical protein